MVEVERYAKLSERVLITKHAQQRLKTRFRESLKDFLRKVGGIRVLESLYQLTPLSEQFCVKVGEHRLVLEKMDSKGRRCPRYPEGEVYLVVVTVLSPSMKWRGNRSRKFH